MIVEGDKVLVGVSGGKDSFVLLKLLTELHSPSKLVALIVNEGIRGYNRPEALSDLKRLCSDLGVDLIESSVKEEYGYDVDDFVGSQLTHYKAVRISACTFCGIARRRLLNKYARELGATKVATGHNLDDEAQTYLINILRGDVMRLIQLHPQSQVYSNKLVKRVKPLRHIYEYETTLYAYMMRFTFQELECPYIIERPSLRVKIRELLEALESEHPGAQLLFLNFMDDIILRLLQNSGPGSVKLRLCASCGEPTSPGRAMCKFCELLNEFLTSMRNHVARRGAREDYRSSQPSPL